MADRLSVPVFIVQPKDGWHRPYRISAPDARKAWGKFCTQYCGVVKPARKDYTIRRDA